MSTAASPVPAVVCRQVSRAYRLPGGRSVPALREVDLRLEPGTVTALVGPSGSGKSTLLRLLACVDRADAGQVEIDGVDVTRLSRPARTRLRRRRIGLVVQNPADNLLEYLTVRQHLELAAQLRGLAADDRQVADLLGRLDLADRAGHLPSELSGGQQQRVAIGFAALGPPALLIADEPTGQLDHHTVGEVLDALEALAGTGVAVVAATHDPAVADRADRTLILRDGRMEEGTRWR